MLSGVKHHLHKRKRAHEGGTEKLHAYPSRSARIKILDNIVMGVAIIMPLTTIPQILQIWIYQTAAGISVLTWSLFFLLAIPMLVYGIVHKVKILIVLNVLWLIVYSFIIVGAIIFG